MRSYKSESDSSESDSSVNAKVSMRSWFFFFVWTLKEMIDETM